MVDYHNLFKESLLTNQDGPLLVARSSRKRAVLLPHVRQFLGLGGGGGWANNVHSTTFWTWRSTFLALFLGLGGWGGRTRVILLRSGHDAPDFSKNVQYYVKVATSLAKNIPGCLCKENMTGTCLGIAKSSWNVQFSGVLNQTIERVQDDWSIQ